MNLSVRTKLVLLSAVAVVGIAAVAVTAQLETGRVLAATAEELSSQAEQLQRTMAFFKLARSNSVAEPRKTTKTATGQRAKQSTASTARPSGAAVASGLALAAVVADASDEA
jgi:methyl-accepting chemotaxis protein